MTDGIAGFHFSREVECVYKDERYSVRDNGAVHKHSREGKRPRPTDNEWTFGKVNDMTGYKEIASVRVHIIVATAFHGERSTKVYVVDHLDTNRRNNRPENLRWLTRLENAVTNPITRKKIEFVCGCSVEEFLANPEKYRDRFQEQNFSWMRTVSADEARACLENMIGVGLSELGTVKELMKTGTDFHMVNDQHFFEAFDACGISLNKDLTMDIDSYIHYQNLSHDKKLELTEVILDEI